MSDHRLAGASRGRRYTRVIFKLVAIGYPAASYSASVNPADRPQGWRRWPISHSARSPSLPDRHSALVFTDFLSFDTFPSGFSILSRIPVLFARTSLYFRSDPAHSFFPSSSAVAINRKQQRRWNLVDWLESRHHGRVTRLRSSPGCFRGGVCEGTGTTVKI